MQNLMLIQHCQSHFFYAMSLLTLKNSSYRFHAKPLSKKYGKYSVYYSVHFICIFGMTTRTGTRYTEMIYGEQHIEPCQRTVEYGPNVHQLCLSITLTIDARLLISKPNPWRGNIVVSKNQPLQSFDENWIACIHVLITQIDALAGNALDFNGTNNLLFNACTSRNHLTVYTWRLVCWSSFFL